MAVTAPTQIKMGYGGYCGIDWKEDTSLLGVAHSTVKTTPTVGTLEPVFITNGNINVAFNRPIQNTYKAPRTTANAVPILLGVGTAQITGSISFDMSHLNLSYFLNSKRLKRNTYFHLVMSDGGSQWAVYYNMWNSFSINGAAGGIINANLGYMSLNCYNADITSYTGTAPANYFNNTLVAYWEAGVDGYVQSFAINITQDVSPVYLNNDLIMPTYLRSGSLKINANIQSCLSWSDIGIANALQLNTSSDTTPTATNFAFNIGTKTITLKNALVNSKQYSHSGAGDVVKYSYGIQSVSLSSPSDDLFTIA